MNPILLYVGHEMCEEFFPFSWQPYSQSHAELLFMNLWGVSLWILVSFFLHQKKIFASILLKTHKSVICIINQTQITRYSNKIVFAIDAKGEKNMLWKDKNYN